MNLQMEKLGIILMIHFITMCPLRQGFIQILVFYIQTSSFQKNLKAQFYQYGNWVHPILNI